MLGKEAKGESPFPLPQTPSPNPEKVKMVAQASRLCFSPDYPTLEPEG